MSYILEALKKADAARERDQASVPGLHSRHEHALPDTTEDSESGLSPRAIWALGGVVGGVVLAGLMAWWMKPAEPSQAVAEAPAQAPPPVPAIVPLIPPGVSTAAPVPATAMSPHAPPVMPPAVPPVAAATPVPTPVVTPAPAPTPVAPHAPITAPIAAPVAATTVAAAAHPAAPAERPAPREAAPAKAPADTLRVDPSLRDTLPRVVSLQELPESVRRELPQLNIGGAMHSDVAANRMLILNGGIFHEGDQPAPGLVLEEIKLKSAVFRYKGHRYSVAY